MTNEPARQAARTILQRLNAGDSIEAAERFAGVGPLDDKTRDALLRFAPLVKRIGSRAAR